MDVADKPTWVRQRACEALLRALANARRLCRRAGPAKRVFTCVSRLGLPHRPARASSETAFPASTTARPATSLPLVLRLQPLPQRREILQDRRPVHPLAAGHLAHGL